MSLRTPAVPAMMLALLLGACTDNAHPEQLAEVDAMMHRADSLLHAMDTLDLAELDRMDSVFRGQRGALEQLLTDTLAKDQAVPLGNYYRAMDRSLGRARRQAPVMRRELERSRAQLADLRHDIGRDRLPEGPRTTYLQQERLVLDELERGVTAVLRSAATCRREWRNSHRAITEMLAPAPTAP